jgi:phosphoserine phosphatase
VTNELIFDENDRLKGGRAVVDPFNKAVAFAGLLDKLNIAPDYAIAVGDSKYDAGFLKMSGLGVGYRPDKELAAVADLVINDWEDFLPYL